MASVTPKAIAAEPASPTPVSVLPDGCNTGVVFRSLLAVNLVCLAGMWLAADNRTILVQKFLDHAMLIEWGTLGSLLLWCAARRLTLRHAVPAGVQRVLALALPALVTAGLLGLLGLAEAAPGALGTPGAFKAIVAAALFGAVLQAYFELRARAFSPALAEARLQALQARIRPHFLFNSLNAVLSLIRADPRKAERTLEDLADLFRVAMQDARHLTSLRQEFELCERYLAIEAVRLGERLQVEWDVADSVRASLDRVRVPALILQPLLENAVHHGVETATGPALIRIAVTRGTDRIAIAIANPVQAGAQGGGGNHMALANIRERLALLYDVEAELSAQAVDGRFEVRLHFPAAGMPVAGAAQAGVSGTGAA
jgi:two-component system sensor histidine kinase AlgZ